MSLKRVKYYEPIVPTSDQIRQAVSDAETAFGALIERDIAGKSPYDSERFHSFWDTRLIRLLRLLALIEPARPADRKPRGKAGHPEVLS